MLFYSNGSPGAVRKWKLEDCVAVHKMLETVFVDQDAATRMFSFFFFFLFCSSFTKAYKGVSELTL